MTDKLREAAQQAIEALEYLRKPIARGWDAEVQLKKRDHSIRALRAALAQQDAQQKHKPLFAEMIAQHPGLAEELAQQDVQAVPQGWQPIETAPKDGTAIDLWHEEFGREADCYWGLPHHCCGEMGSLCDSDWHSLEPGWVGTFNEIMSPANAYTHWMPLPPSPDAAPTPPAVIAKSEGPAT